MWRHMRKASHFSPGNKFAYHRGCLVYGVASLDVMGAATCRMHTNRLDHLAVNVKFSSNRWYASKQLTINN